VHVLEAEASVLRVLLETAIASRARRCT
jgi:hypothetical protein